MTLAKSTENQGFSVFGSKPKDAILVPEMPLNRGSIGENE
jgi:hypothetical protein